MGHPPGSWRAKLRSLLAAGGVVVIGAACLGATCNTNECTTCAAGQEIACIDRCVTPVPVGEACSLTDPCAPNCRCEGSASCVPVSLTNPDQGACMSFGLGLGAGCQVLTPDLCSNELYCHKKECFGGTQNVCALPVALGGICDSNWAAPSCMPCVPGSSCTDGICHKPCAVTGDCPCNQGWECPPTSLDTKGGFCTRCKHKGDTGCDMKENPCCDASVCGTTGQCCMPRGQACAATGDCCNTDVCQGGTCQACKNAGAACTGTSECCDTATCMGGVCTPPCALHHASCANAACCGQDLCVGYNCAAGDGNCFSVQEIVATGPSPGGNGLPLTICYPQPTPQPQPDAGTGADGGVVGGGCKVAADCPWPFVCCAGQCLNKSSDPNNCTDYCGTGACNCAAGSAEPRMCCGNQCAKPGMFIGQADTAGCNSVPQVVGGNCIP